MASTDNHSQAPSCKYTCEAAISNLPAVLKKMHQFLEATPCRAGTRIHLEMILEEFFVNVASYAYPNATGPVTVEMSVDDYPYAVRITLRDKGTPYNPLETKDPDLSLSSKERRIGGLGIFLSKKFADSISYRRENDENILSFTKKLP